MLFLKDGDRIEGKNEKIKVQDVCLQHYSGNPTYSRVSDSNRQDRIVCLTY